MSLASKLVFDFDLGVQERGLRVFNSRLVKVHQSAPEPLTGQVIGNNLCDISLEFEDSALRVYCDCPYFAEHGQCKHIWAGILEADRLGALRLAAQSPRLTLQEDFLDNLFDDLPPLD